MAPNAKIDVFLDCVSPYSYYAMLYLLKNREALRSHGVKVEFHPVFLGGINVGSGNKPPWTLPAKGVYSGFDGNRAKKYFGAPNVKTPGFFPILSLLPQRCIIYVKDHFPQEQYERAFKQYWVAMWEENKDISKPELLAETLSPFFTEKEVQEILKAASDPVYKQKLNDNTQKALDYGAFGAPWLWVTNKHGTAEPFFGSDRFTFMWQFLELPFTDLTLHPAGQKARI